jgi:hypothetical protein
MSGPAVLPSITCEKCKQGTMVAQRMGNGLNIIGYTLVVPALLLLVFSTACGVFLGNSGSTLLAGRLGDARARASVQLLDIRELPRSEAEEFRETGRLSRAALEALPNDARVRVDSIVSRYSTSRAESLASTGVAAGAVGFVVIAAFVIGLPFLGVGLLLIRKKNVWRCPSCAYVLDRAS